MFLCSIVYVQLQGESMSNKRCDSSVFSLMVYNCLTQQAAGVLQRHVIRTNQLW